MKFSAGEQWDQLLEVANDFARIDIRGEQEISEEEDEEPFIDDKDPDARYVVYMVIVIVALTCLSLSAQQHLNSRWHQWLGIPCPWILTLFQRRRLFQIQRQMMVCLSSCTPGLLRRRRENGWHRCQISEEREGEISAYVLHVRYVSYG